MQRLKLYNTGVDCENTGPAYDELYNAKLSCFAEAKAVAVYQLRFTVTFIRLEVCSKRQVICPESDLSYSIQFSIDKLGNRSKCLTLPVINLSAFIKVVAAIRRSASESNMLLFFKYAFNSPNFIMMSISL